jgi:predicted AlkP superfamily pyrophosphatase or phosphodiesterase
VLGNSYLDRDTGKSVGLIVDPVFDKSEIVLVPTIYDVAHEAGLKTAGIIWPATRNAKTLDWTVPDMAGEDSWPKYATPSWMAELRAAGLPVDRHAGLTKVPLGGVQRDWLYTRLFSHVIQNHAPNLILVHLVEIDHVEHQFGPRSPEAYWVTSYADDRLRDIVEAAHKSRFGDNVTFVFLSDHGFYPIDKDIRLNALFKLQAGEGKPVGKASTQGGACMIYLSEANRTPEVIQKVKDLIAGVEGVQAVYSPDEFEQLGQFTPDVDRRAPDLWVAAKSGYSFDNSDAGADIVTPRATHGGTHGFLPSEKDLYATLVLSGAGIEPGVDLGEVSNLDVAPTIAELLGVSMPTAQGKVLKAALKK